MYKIILEDNVCNSPAPLCKNNVVSFGGHRYQRLGDVVDQIWMVARPDLQCSIFLDGNLFGTSGGHLYRAPCFLSGGEILSGTSRSSRFSGLLCRMFSDDAPSSLVMKFVVSRCASSSVTELETNCRWGNGLSGVKL